MKRQHYRILDVGLCLESDSEEFLRMFDRDYSLFATPMEDGGTRMHVSLTLEKEGESPSLRIKGSDFSLEGHHHPILCAYQMINKALMEEVRDFVVVHAGVVARGNDALAICGPPGAGKTTLVLALLESGFSLLSDDFCPIHKETGLVHPFLRSLWVSDRSSYTAGGFSGPSQSPFRSGKFPFKPEVLRIPVAQEPRRLKTLICLDPGDDDASWSELRIKLKKEHEDEFLSALQQTGEVVIGRTNAELCNWSIRYRKKQGPAERIRALLTRYGHCVWSVIRSETVHPDFGAEPVLTPIPVYEAAFFAMKELKQELSYGWQDQNPPVPGNIEAGSEPFELKPSMYFMQLIALLGEAFCYRLTPGRFEPLRNLAMDAAGYEPSPSCSME